MKFEKSKTLGGFLSLLGVNDHHLGLPAFLTVIRCFECSHKQTKKGPRQTLCKFM